MTHTATIEVVTSKEVFDACISIEWAAYHDPYRPEYQFQHPVFGLSDADRAASIKFDQDRLWGDHVKNPASHWICARDDASGEIIGACHWAIYSENPFPDGPKKPSADWLPEGEFRNFTEAMVAQIYACHQNWMARPHITFDATAVHPHFRGRGIGKLMMQWGMAKADALGLEAFVEASFSGCSLYEQFGMRVVHTIANDMAKRDASDAWKALAAQLGSPTMYMLWRPKFGDWSGKSGPNTIWEAMKAA